jgi:MoxR-like ATPase
MTGPTTTHDDIAELTARMGQSIIGQVEVIDRLIIGLLANGNLLVEGLPGLAKTRAIKAMASNLDAKFSRIQFTPDLLPSDVTGTEIYTQSEAGGSFRFDPGPIFANIVLADEINRAPAKVQAALLEAMEERQVTVAGTTHRMEPLFIVMATQNPIEQEGTYPLPEAQMDRFLMHVNITYPPVGDEVEVIRLVRGEEIAAISRDGPKAGKDRPAAIPQDAVFAARNEIAQIHVSDAMERYMADRVYATRTPKALSDDLAGATGWGLIGSPTRSSSWWHCPDRIPQWPLKPICNLTRASMWMARGCAALARRRARCRCCRASLRARSSTGTTPRACAARAKF